MADYSTPDSTLQSHAKAGLLRQVRKALAAGANINARDECGDTPLLLASYWNPDSGVSEFLIERGARVDVRNRSGETVLHGFARQGFVDLARRAIDEFGIALDGTARDRTTPLLEAASRGGQPMVAFLLERGANIAAADGGRKTALHWAAWGRDPDVVDTLLAAGADVHATDRQGDTPLSGAATVDSAAVCARLLAAGAHLDHRSTDKSTPLLLAAKCGNLATFEMLLQAGADPGLRNSHKVGIESLAKKNADLELIFSAWRARVAMKNVIDQAAGNAAGASRAPGQGT